MKLQSHISPAAVAALLLVVPLKVTELEALGISLSTMSHHSKENSAHSVVCFMSVPNKSEDSEGKQEPKAEYGVSYIGGDPCGSKYNDDPFDAQVQKPGMPDDMKARIQAIVEKKLAEEKATEDNDEA